MEKEKELPSVVLTERAAQVFKDSCKSEGTTLQETFLRIGAKPGGCSGWKYELESNTHKDVGPNDIKILEHRLNHEIADSKNVFQQVELSGQKLQRG